MNYVVGLVGEQRERGFSTLKASRAAETVGVGEGWGVQSARGGGGAWLVLLLERAPLQQQRGAEVDYQVPPTLPNHLTERVNKMVSRKSMNPQTRKLNLITRNSEIYLTDLWVN